MEAREELAMYVNTGTMRDSEPSPKMAPERAKEITAKLATLREGGSLPAASDAPSDFRAAITDKEAQVAAREDHLKGKDIPRVQTRIRAVDAILRQLYAAHDTVAELPTPTGLGVIIFVIFIFFLILIPATAAGETRAMLLWEVLLGQKKVDPIDVPVVDGGSGQVTKQQQPTIPVPNPIPGQPPIQVPVPQLPPGIGGAIGGGIGIGIGAGLGTLEEPLGFPSSVTYVGVE